MKLAPVKLLLVPLSGLFIPNVDVPEGVTDPNDWVAACPPKDDPKEPKPKVAPDSEPAAGDPNIPDAAPPPVPPPVAAPGPNNPAPRLLFEGVALDDPKEGAD